MLRSGEETDCHSYKSNLQFVCSQTPVLDKTQHWPLTLSTVRKKLAFVYIQAKQFKTRILIVNRVYPWKSVFKGRFIHTGWRIKWVLLEITFLWMHILPEIPKRVMFTIIMLEKMPHLSHLPTDKIIWKSCRNCQKETPITWYITFNPWQKKTNGENSRSL